MRNDTPRFTFPGLARSAATGFCFLFFWVLAVTATIILLPVMVVLPGNRHRRVRRLASLGFRVITGLSERLGIFRFRIEGEEWFRAAEGRLVVANHPCFLDVVVLLGRLPQANCIMKAALRRHPLFAPFVYAGGYISNASDPRETLAACGRAKERGEAIIIFPEGSRTPAGATPQLHRGAAQIALREEMEILPVTIECSPPVLTHGRRWYAMPSRPVEYVISFHAPLAPSAFAAVGDLPPSLAARRVTRGMDIWFKRHLQAMKTPRIEPKKALRSSPSGRNALRPGRPQ